MRDDLLNNATEGISFFNIMTESQRTDIENASHIVNYKSGELLFKIDTPISHVMYLKSGLVKVFKEARNGKVIIIDLVASGSFISLLSVFCSGIYQYNASVVEDAQVVLLDIYVLRKLMKENGSVANLLLEETCRQGMNTLTKLLNQSHKQLPGRVAEMLLTFSEKIYKSKSFNLPLSRRELAELTGTTKESMIRTLAEFRHDKIISIEGKKVEIISPGIINTLSRLG